MIHRIAIVISVIALGGLFVWVNSWTCVFPEQEMAYALTCETRRFWVSVIAALMAVMLVIALMCGYPDVRDDAYTND